MRLHYSTTSPFVRKVLVTAIELGLDRRIERVLTKTRPNAPDPLLMSHNPLGKLPALETDDGEWVYDSPVICEYLDGLASGRTLIPRGGWERIRVLRTQALADGIIDAAVLAYYERLLRPADKVWPEWIEGQLRKVRESFDVLERSPEMFGGPFDLGQAAVACAVGYIEFRQIIAGLPAKWPRTYSWYREAMRRRSLAETTPHE